jgi:hypothetical protein
LEKANPMRYGIFENLKGSTTLLIWGNENLSHLAGLFRNLADQPGDNIRFEDVPWLAAVEKCSVTVTHADVGKGSLRISGTLPSVSVEFHATRGDLLDFADLVGVLAEARCTHGHQYLEVSPSQPIQIIVSKGEYSPDLRPHP